MKDEMQQIHPVLDAPTIGLSLLEKLMLALIDGYDSVEMTAAAKSWQKTDGRTRDQRLRAAMHAIAPPYYRHGKHGCDDGLVLHWMAVQVMRKERHLMPIKIGPDVFGETSPTVNFNSTRTLAVKAIEYFGLDTSLRSKRSVIDRLTKSFESQRFELCMGVVHADPQPHFVEHHLLKKIAKVLRSAGVAVKLPEHPSAF